MTEGPGPVALCGGTVVRSLDPPDVVQGDLVITGDRILGVQSPPPGAVRRDCSGTLILPGNVCAHHHLYSALARGMPFTLTAPTNFTEILQRIWWRLDRALEPSSVRMSALRGGLDALLAGTTTVIDHHASPNAIDGSLDLLAEALEELGLRSVLCYEVTDRDGAERARAGIRENERFLALRRKRTRGLMGAHASFTLSDDTLAGCVDVARRAGVGIHIHVAEDLADQQDAQAGWGTAVVERLATAGVVTDSALLAHCVRVGAEEIDLIAAAGATVACNPRSNLNNGVGFSPFNLRAGRIALGTDGIGGDLVAESQVGFFRTREASLEAPPDWPLTRLAGSAALAARIFAEPQLGTLTAGAPADLVVLDYATPTPLDAANLAGHWTFGLSCRQVKDVYVAGERVVADGHSTRVDEAKVAAESERETERLWGRLEAIPAHEFTPKGGEWR